MLLLLSLVVVAVVVVAAVAVVTLIVAAVVVVTRLFDCLGIHVDVCFSAPEQPEAPSASFFGCCCLFLPLSLSLS